MGVLAHTVALSQHQVGFVAEATEHFFQREIGHMVEMFWKFIELNYRINLGS